MKWAVLGAAAPVGVGPLFALEKLVEIALVTEFYYPHTGGVTEHVHHLGRFLGQRGHRVRIVTSHVDEAPRRPDLESIAPRVTVQRLGRGVSISSNGSQARVTVGFGLPLQMREALRGCDVVHVHSPLFPVLPYLALKAARRLGLPTVGTFHTHFGESLALTALARLVRAYAGALDRAIAVSPSAARSVRRFFGRSAPHCQVIPNGVDADAWSAAAPAPSGRPTIVFLGRLDPRNDLEVLLDAFARVRSALPSAELLIVGDGPRRRALQATAPSGVVFAGAQSEVSARAGLLASAQVMAFTARIVSHPMALLEGLAAGLPAVAYDIEGVRELVVEGRHGYKVPVGRADALAEALLRVLGDEPRRLSMAKEAQCQARRYDWRYIGERVERVYESIFCAVEAGQGAA